MRDTTDLDGASAEKYRYIREQQLLRREQGIEFLDPEEVPVLPEWEAQIQQLQEIKEQESTDGADSDG